MKTKIGFGVVTVLTMAAALGATTVAGLRQDDQAKAEMMEKWKAFGTPGEGHKVLDKMVGSWNVKTTMREAPGGPADQTSAVSQFEWIFDGRFLEESTTGSFNDAPFVGRGFLGYDNFGKKYVMTWMDNLSTMMMIAEGSFDPASKELRFTSQCPDFKTGKYVPSRWVVAMSDPDHWIARIHKAGPDGKDFVAAEMDYTRAK